MAAEQEKKKEQEVEPKSVNRGWILGVSILYEVAIFLGIYCLIKFLPITIGWKVLLGVGGGLGVSFLTFGLIYWWWAPNNLFFTFVREGTVKIVVRAHQYDKALLQFKNHALDDKGNVVRVFSDEGNTKPDDIWVKVGDQGNWIKNGEILDVIGVVDEEKGILKVRKEMPIVRKKHGIEKIEMEKLVKSVRQYKPIKPCKEKPFFGGLKYYGLWPIYDIFTYEFRWTGVKESGEFESHPPETIDFIILKDDVYGCKIEKAEDIELMPLDFELTLTVRIVNPYKALFRIENWFETMINRIRPHIRDFATTKTYAEMIKELKRVETAIWARLSEGGILDELKDRYGVEIRKIEVKDINPMEEFRKVTMANVLALREKEAIITRAGAEKERLKTVAQGERSRIDAVYGAVRDFGELGEKIRGYEALEKSTGEGAKWVIPVEVTRLFSRVLSREQSYSRPRRD